MTFKMKILYKLLLILLLWSCSHSDYKPKDDSINRLTEISVMCGFEADVANKNNIKLYDTLHKIIKDTSQLNNIELVRTYTSSLLDTFNICEDSIIYNTGGISHEYRYKGRFNTAYIEQVFLRKGGLADKLQASFQRYQNTVPIFGYIGLLDGKNPLYKHDKRFKNKNFGFTYFKNANVLESLTTIELLKMEILYSEREYYENILIKNVM